MSNLTLLEPLHKAFSSVRAQQSAVDDLIEGLFDELERMREEVSSRLSELETQQQIGSELQVSLAERDADIKRLQEAFDECQMQLTRAKEEFSAGSDDEGRSLQLQSELDSVQKELSNARAAADQKDEDVTRLRKQLEDQDKLVEQLRNREPTGNDDFDVERDSLLDELEEVRNYASELHDQLTEQRYQAEADKRDLNDQIAQLRRGAERALEAQETPPAQPARRSKKKPAEPTRSKSRSTKTSTKTKKRSSSQSEPPASSDVVVDSVMAQFAKLQRDVAQRRKPKK